AMLAAGAVDAWITPSTMKKGRPGNVVSALCDGALAAQVAAVLAEETGSLGVRVTRVERVAADRRLEEVEVGGVAVRVKVSPGRVKAEFDDAAHAARVLGRPAREVVQLAEETWRRRDRSPAAGRQLLPPPEAG
ncbi:MAG TPA: nickel insertion protein, partial [Acidimicrobiales bacterium]|nr:nickel insertion protein [Acidimicrobiales bacterium]